MTQRTEEVQTFFDLHVSKKYAIRAPKGWRDVFGKHTLRPYIDPEYGFTIVLRAATFAKLVELHQIVIMQEWWFSGGWFARVRIPTIKTTVEIEERRMTEEERELVFGPIPEARHIPPRIDADEAVESADEQWNAEPAPGPPKSISLLDYAGSKK